MLPILTVAGIAALWRSPVVGTLFVAQTVRRAAEFGVAWTVLCSWLGRRQEWRAGATRELSAPAEPSPSSAR